MKDFHKLDSEDYNCGAYEITDDLEPVFRHTETVLEDVPRQLHVDLAVDGTTTRTSGNKTFANHEAAASASTSSFGSTSKPGTSPPTGPTNFLYFQEPPPSAPGDHATSSRSHRQGGVSSDQFATRPAVVSSSPEAGVKVFSKKTEKTAAGEKASPITSTAGEDEHLIQPPSNSNSPAKRDSRPRNSRPFALLYDGGLQDELGDRADFLSTTAEKCGEDAWRSSSAEHHAAGGPRPHGGASSEGSNGNGVSSRNGSKTSSSVATGRGSVSSSSSSTCNSLPSSRLMTPRLHEKQAATTTGAVAPGLHHLASKTNKNTRAGGAMGSSSSGKTSRNKSVVEEDKVPRICVLLSEHHSAKRIVRPPPANNSSSGENEKKADDLHSTSKEKAKQSNYSKSPSNNSDPPVVEPRGCGSSASDLDITVGHIPSEMVLASHEDHLSDLAGGVPDFRKAVYINVYHYGTVRIEIDKVGKFVMHKTDARSSSSWKPDLLLFPSGA